MQNEYFKCHFSFTKINLKRKISDCSEHGVVVTRHSNLSASAHAIFHLHVGRVHQEKTIESRHPTLLALRIIIRESAQVTIIYTLLIKLNVYFSEIKIFNTGRGSR